MKFDDAEGVSIEGYTFDKETGKWGAESPAPALFNEYGVDPGTYTLAEVDGVVVGTDNETGKEIFRDGRFEISYAAELAKKDCEPTDFVPDKNGFVQPKFHDSYEDFIYKIIEDLNFPPSLNWWVDVLINREKQCWAIADGSNLYYRDDSGMARAMPLIPLTSDEIISFSFGRE